SSRKNSHSERDACIHRSTISSRTATLDGSEPDKPFCERATAELSMAGLCHISAGGFARLHRLLFKLFHGRFRRIDDPLQSWVAPIRLDRRGSFSRPPRSNDLR